MMQKSYFQMTLEKTIQQTEKLLKLLKSVHTDYEDKRMEDTMEKAVSAAKQAEEVALLTRALPAHTGHPRPKELTRNAIAEAISLEIGFTDQGWFCLRMPILLPRKEKSSRNYIRGFLYPEQKRFAAGRRIRYRNCVLIFRHVYDRNRPEREYRDHDNIELNTVVDAIAMFFLVDDTPLECRHYYCSAAGIRERTEVYIVPRNEFEDWLAQENSILDIGLFLYKDPPIPREKHT
jgi:hypothetical protein